MANFKRIGGVALLLIAIGILIIGFGTPANHSQSQSVLDSPEASGRTLGILIPVVLFGAVGGWLLFAKQRGK